MFRGRGPLIGSGSSSGARAGHVRQQRGPRDFLRRLPGAYRPHGDSLLAKGKCQPFAADLNFTCDGPGEFLHGLDSWNAGDGCEISVPNPLQASYESTTKTAKIMIYPRFGSFHPAKNGLQVSALRNVNLKGMIRRGPGNFENLNRAARLPCGSAQALQASFFADQPRAGTREENSARRHDLQSKSIHIEVSLESETHRFTVARLLGRVENDDIKTLPAGQDVAKPMENIGLHETDSRLIQVGILTGQLEGLFIEVDGDHFFGVSQGLGVNGKSARVAA